MMTQNSDWIISGLNIYTEQEILPSAGIRIQNQTISEISNHLSGSNYLEFPSHYHLIPGRIDLHIHGAGGKDVMDSTPEALDKIRQTLAKEGITGFLATTLTATVSEIDHALKNIDLYGNQSTINGAEILGIHLEGPFIAPEYLGAHRGELILKPDLELFKYWQTCAGGKIKSVTIAPELPGALALIKCLHAQGVVAAIGHTNASFLETQTAIDAGATHATHLFNAMRPFHHREPGCVGAILVDDRITAELIVDGHHSHSGAWQLALKTKGVDRLILVTDAMRAKCCQGSGHFDLGGQIVTVENGAARLANGVLAGSVLTMTQAVKNMLIYTNCDLQDLINMTSLNPAKILKLDQSRGSIKVGKRADLTVLDENWEVVMTICAGKIIYQRG